MTPPAVGALARAVTDAGGLGMIGVKETWTLGDIARECADARRGNPTRRFGVGFFGVLLESQPALLDAVIEQQPFLISISFIDVAPYARAIRAAGIKLAAQVQSRADAERALVAGVDLLVAQGTEAGGHTGDVSTLLMLQIALDISPVPVLAAGGVASPRAMAAVLVPDAARERIVAARETDTVLTSLFDRMQGVPWPRRLKGRALQNDLTREWHGREDDAVQDARAMESLKAAVTDGGYDVANVYAGQSAGLLNKALPAAKIVEWLGAGAEKVLRDRCVELL